MHGIVYSKAIGELELEDRVFEFFFFALSVQFLIGGPHLFLYASFRVYSCLDKFPLPIINYLVHRELAYISWLLNITLEIALEKDVWVCKLFVR